MWEQFWIYVFIMFVFIIASLIYFKNNSETSQLKCVLTTKNGIVYCVRDRANVQQAANLLAEASHTCSKLVKYMEKAHAKDERTKRLISKFNETKIKETLPTSTLTAYTENKGEKVAFCLNKKKENNNNLIDLHTLTFVAIHELSHIASAGMGHKQEFWENFKFLLECAEEANIYTSRDYKKNPQDYCGITIGDNPKYDLV